MADKVADAAPSALLAHGAEALSRVTVDAYNAELRTSEGFVGDRASKRAFQAILDDWRERVSKMGEDPLGEQPSEEISKKQLDKVLLEGDPEAAGMVHSAIEEFAQEFAAVIRRFLRLKEWKNVERIAVGGGLRQSRIGELAIGRTSVALKGEATKSSCVRSVTLPTTPASSAACISCRHGCSPATTASWPSTSAAATSAPASSNSMRRRTATWPMPTCIAWSSGGIGTTRRSARMPWSDSSSSCSISSSVRAKDGLTLAPFIGIGCPGVIRPDGSIERGGQNLPGNWEAKGFNLPQRLREALPKIGDHETVIVMHNDAVVQGLSELPWMQDVKHWGVMTIGTGLGNAHFTNRAREEDSRT